jgi:hypothetical protein
MRDRTINQKLSYKSKVGLEAALQDNRLEKNGHRGLQNSGHWEIKIVKAWQQGDEA